MLNDVIEHRWLDAFQRVFALCKLEAGAEVAILSETQSRPLNRELARLALQQLGLQVFEINLPTPAQRAPVPVRSTGASQVLHGQAAALEALKASAMVVDLTLEGLLHAPQLPAILGAGSRVMMVSNEHPEALERLVPEPADERVVRAAIKACRAATRMTVSSAAGTDLVVDLTDARTGGVWGWADKPGMVSHWPGGIVVNFPRPGSVNGRLVLDVGDINLTFKRYLEHPVELVIENDYVTAVNGSGTDAELMRRYLAAWGDREAYGVSHVGWGLNERARYEALTMYDQRDTNGTELRAYAGNFLYSTGANEVAGRFTEGHFDLPAGNCTVCLDDVPVVEHGRLVKE
ncbi:MAG: peptidase M29 [Gammaproteobacteria bacterium]|nr:peptidase M29 [Gammaproteobacteria bacterium]MCP5198630.1 peptidase M29 [Gammaproteobacteria bacterium]